MALELRKVALSLFHNRDSREDFTLCIVEKEGVRYAGGS